MNSSQLLDARRNIRKEIVAFISIVMIGLLAALAYLGIAYTAAALKQDALYFFNTRQLWDAEVTSTMLMTDEDLEAIRALPGVSEAEPVWEIETRLQTGGGNTAVSIVSLPEKMSLPVMLEGRLPASAKECAVERNLAEECGFTVGQQLTLNCSKIMDVDPLVESTLEITGIFHTPDHFSYMVPVTPYIFVTRDCFNQEGFDGAFMKTRVRVADAPENRYSDEYRNTVRPVTDALETLSADRAPARSDDIRSGFEDRMRDGEAQIESAREQLAQGQQKLEEGWKELASFEKQLEPVPGLLDAGEAKLREGEIKLEEALALLEKYGIKFDEDASFLGQLEDARHMINHAGLFFDRMAESGAISREVLDSYDGDRSALDNMTALEALSEIERRTGGAVGLGELKGKLKTFRDGIEAYEQGRLDYYYSGEQYLDALAQLDKGRKKLIEGEKELTEGKEKLRQGEEDLAHAKEQLDQIGTCRWILLNNNGNPGFIYAAANSDKLSSLSMSFSSIFLVVGALVIYATISRMVEQQRKLIGVNKAMGLFSSEIFAKYLLFACSAVLLGVGLGVVLAWGPMQRAVLNSYEAHLNYGVGARSFLPVDTAIVVVGALGLSVLAVYLGCSQLLRETALSLMQGAKPTAGRKKQRGSSAKKSLYYRLILRNMGTDWNRVLVTIASIAGGCVLMVTGFTLRYGISGVPDRQFGGIQTYDAEVFYNVSANESVVTEVDELLNRNGLEHINVRKESTVYDTDGSLDALTMIITEKGSLDGYFKLQDAANHAAIDIPDSGALVPKRFWEHYGTGIGDEVTVYDSELNHCQVRVSGVFDNYYGQIFFLSRQGYQEAFGTEAQCNCFFVRTNGMSLNELQQKLDGIEGVVNVNDAAAERTMIEQFTNGLNFVVYLMLFIAGMMACFIVANFTMTFIQRKISELTIMRINGFSAGECIRYVAVDLAVTTVLGTLVGLVIGGFMGFHILKVTETPYIQMIREPRLESFLFSAAITFLFSLITNGFALRRIRKLKLTDIS